MGPKPQTIPTMNQTTFWVEVRSPRPRRFTHIRIIAMGCKTIESRISKKSFTTTPS